MADGIHPAMDRVQAAAVDPMIDPPTPESQLTELSPRHHTMLPPSQVGNRHVNAPRPHFAPYFGVNCGHGGDGGRLATQCARGVRGVCRKRVSA